MQEGQKAVAVEVEVEKALMVVALLVVLAAATTCGGGVSPRTRTRILNGRSL